MKLYSLVPSAVLLAAAAAFGILHATTVSPGGLVKGSLPAVYYIGEDGKRYVFPNDKVYFSWYADFSAVNSISDADLAKYQIGGNATYRPGVKLVKIQSDPKVYAVDAGGRLRWVKTEAAAVALFGGNWNKQIDDISDSFFVNYKSGTDIASASDFNPTAVKNAASSISADKQLSSVPTNENVNANVNANVNTNANVPVSEAACSPACALGDACVVNSCKAVPGPSPIKVTTFIIDKADVCFIGDACTTGACCSIGGTKFADNGNLKAVRPIDKYLYADKQQLCGHSTVTAMDRDAINQDLNNFSNTVASATNNRVSVGVGTTRLTGEFTMSRVPGGCDWWIAPNDLRDRLIGQVDNTTDAVFVIGAKTFDFGDVSALSSHTVDQSEGLAGAGYSYINKEWPLQSGNPVGYSVYNAALAAQMNSAVDFGVTKADAAYVGNHCRDGRRDFDETGTDCGGVGCNACYY